MRFRFTLLIVLYAIVFLLSVAFLWMAISTSAQLFEKQIEAKLNYAVIAVSNQVQGMKVDSTSKISTWYGIQQPFLVSKNYEKLRKQLGVDLVWSVKESEGKIKATVSDPAIDRSEKPSWTQHCLKAILSQQEAFSKILSLPSLPSNANYMHVFNTDEIRTRFNIYTGDNGQRYIAGASTNIKVGRQAIIRSLIIKGLQIFCVFLAVGFLAVSYVAQRMNKSTHSLVSRLKNLVEDGKTKNKKNNLGDYSELEAVIQGVTQFYQESMAALKKSKEQARKFQKTQKELRLLNEGLEAQTHVLIQSEEALKKRQEELTNNNEKLEEQSTELEKQKHILKEKNLALENANHEIEQKAIELETISRYKSEFLANMSHELRTPLNSILLLSRYLSDDSKGNLTDKQRQCADTVHSSGNELLALINEVLDLTRVESGNMVLEPETFLINDFTTDLDRKFRPVADDRGLQFSIEIDGKLPETIRTDKLRLSQILKNLLSNAFKFTESGGVTLEVEYQEAYLSVVFNVCDTGSGIPENKQEIIFDAFKQVDGSISRKYGGTGLGLSISKKYASVLNGTLTLSSTIGKGSVFSLRIPSEINDAEDVTENKANDVNVETEVNDSQALSTIKDSETEFDFTGMKILITDDDMRNVFSLISILEDRGIDTIVAQNGNEALIMLEEHPDISLILMDIMMPEMDGPEAIQEIRKTITGSEKIPIIALTAKAMKGDKEKCLEAGADDYLSKPIDTDTLFSMMRSWITKKSKA